MTVTAVIGALAGQRLVSTLGGKMVALLGLGLLGGASLVLTRVVPHGNTLATVVVGMIGFGLGMGATTAAAQITALNKVAKQFAGIGASLTDTSFALGTALGVAIATSVAIARTQSVIHGHHVAAVSALTSGSHWAFGATAAFCLFESIGMTLVSGEENRRHSRGRAEKAAVVEPVSARTRGAA
jgi:MFS family permease